MIFEIIVITLLTVNIVLITALYLNLVARIETAREELITGFYADIYKSTTKHCKEVLAHLDNVLSSMDRQHASDKVLKDLLKAVINDGK